MPIQRIALDREIALHLDERSKVVFRFKEFIRDRPFRISFFAASLDIYYDTYSERPPINSIQSGILVSDWLQMCDYFESFVMYLRAMSALVSSARSPFAKHVVLDLSRNPLEFLTYELLFRIQPYFQPLNADGNGSFPVEFYIHVRGKSGSGDDTYAAIRGPLSVDEVFRFSTALRGLIREMEQRRG